MSRQPSLGVTRLEQRETPGSMMPTKPLEVGMTPPAVHAAPLLSMGPTAGNSTIVEIDYTIIPPSNP